MNTLNTSISSTTLTTDLYTTYPKSAYTSTTLANSTIFHSSNGHPILKIPQGEEKMVLEKAAELEVKGKLVVNGTLVINGEDLNDRLSRIEVLLNIPVRDITMENKYPKLKNLWEQYTRELEKYKTWEVLKKDKLGIDKT